MQFNLITQLTAAPSPAAPVSHDEPQQDKGFAKILGDNDAKGGHEQSKQGLPGNEPKATALVAQEVSGDTPILPVLTDSVTKLLSQPIGPDEAKALLSKLDVMSEHSEQHEPAFDQLKEALEDVVNGGEATDLGNMLEALPEVADAQPADRAPVLQRLIGWVSTAIDKHKEAPVAGAMPDGTAQSLQASLFSAGDDATRIEAQTTAQTDRDKKTDDATAQTTAASVVSAVILVPTPQVASMPEWVKKLGEGEENIAADAVNEAIPPLALTEEDETLPVVNLPGADDVASVKAEPKVASRNFHELLNHLPVANDNQEQDAAPAVVSVDANGVVSAPHAPAAHNTSSLTPITVSAHSHLTPHMAAAEQVHVAITSMKEDGLNSITMQLEPTDLGRVEIKMDTVDGKTNISFLVDKPETLDALSRDARSLERQLQEAGVRADAGSMQFNLRQQPQQEMADDAKDGKGSGSIGLDEPVSIEGALTKHYTLNVREGVDIHA